MVKKLILFLGIFISMLFVCVYASELTLLSDNTLIDGDLKAYSDNGEPLSFIKTGAEYKISSDSDSEFKETISNGGAKKLTSGCIKSYASQYVGTCKWNSNAVSTVIFDLKAVYDINRVDIWTIASKSQQLGDVEIKVSTDGANYTKIGKYPSKTVPLEKGDGGYYPRQDKFMFDTVKGRFISLTFKKATVTGTGDMNHQFVLNEVLIFNEENEGKEEEPYISDVKILKSNGDKGFSYSSGEELTACCDIKNTKACVLVAGFDKNGRLISVNSKDGECNGRLACDYVAEENCDCIKAFVFDSKESLKPVCEPAELTQRDVEKSGLISGKKSLLEDEIYDTNPKYRWTTEGNYKTESDITNDTDKLFDGDISTVGSTTGEWANLIIDFDLPMEITDVSVRAMCSQSSQIDKYDIYASLDGENYGFIGDCINTNNPKLNRVMSCNREISHRVYAKSVKLLIHKNQDAEDIKIAEVEVLGKPISLKKNRLINYSYERDIPFKTKNDMVSADNENKKLTDGNKEKYTETSGDYACIIFEAEDYCQVEDICVYGEASGMETLLSPDGVNYKSTGYSRFQDGKAFSCGVSGKNARFVKLVVHRGDYKKIKLSEVEVYAREIFDENREKNQTPENIEIYTELKPNNILYIDFTDYDEKANDTDGNYKVYIEENQFSSIELKPVKDVYVKGEGVRQKKINEKYCCYAGLKPDTDYYVAVAAEGQREVTPVKIHTYPELYDGKAAAMFGINDFPEGGGNHVAHDDEKTNLKRKIKLLNAMEAMQKTRVWYEIPDVYRANGITYLPLGVRSEETIKTANSNGVHTFEVFNEPEISEDYNDPEVAIEKMKKDYELAKGIDENNLLAAPTICGTDWLWWQDSLYDVEPNLGLYYDVVDIHLYPKVSEGMNKMDDWYTDFERYSVPEHLYGKMNRLREMLLRREGAPVKRIIASEMGWATHKEESWSQVADMVDEETQAKFIARAYLNGFNCDLKELHIYAFQDEYIDKYESEYCYGMVDWYTEPKQGYFSAYTLLKVLRDAEYVGMPYGISHPNYGSVFWDENKGKYITALWTADGEERHINIIPKNVKVIDMYGNTYEATNNQVTINSKPIYILSDEMCF